MEDALRHASLLDELAQLRVVRVAQEQQLAQRGELLASREQQLTRHESTITQHEATLTQHQSTITQHQATIAKLTKQRDAYYLEKLQLEVRLAKALKQAYGPRADRVGDMAQMLLEFGLKLEALPIPAEEASPAPEESAKIECPPSRRLRTRGRRDLGTMDHLPLVEKTYELSEELCRCPACQKVREKIGTEVTYTIEYTPASFSRIKHIQCKYVRGLHALAPAAKHLRSPGLRTGPLHDVSVDGRRGPTSAADL